MTAQRTTLDSIEGLDLESAESLAEGSSEEFGSEDDLLDVYTVTERLFETEEITPCRRKSDKDLWFSPFRDKMRAARMCMDCPFRGRCGYNAVASRATHGVWAGEILPGDRPAQLEPIYTRLLTQFEERRSAELGAAPAPPMPAVDVRRRRPSTRPDQDQAS